MTHDERRTSVRLPEDLHHAVRLAAVEDRTTARAIIEAAMREWLARRDAQPAVVPLPAAWPVTPAVETDEAYIPAMVAIPVHLVRCGTCRERRQAVLDAAGTLLRHWDRDILPAVQEALIDLQEEPMPAPDYAACAGARHALTFVAQEGTRGQVAADPGYHGGERTLHNEVLTVPVEAVTVDPPMGGPS